MLSEVETGPRGAVSFGLRAIRCALVAVSCGKSISTYRDMGMDGVRDYHQNYASSIYSQPSARTAYRSQHPVRRFERSRLQ